MRAEYDILLSGVSKVTGAQGENINFAPPHIPKKCSSKEILKNGVKNVYFLH